MTFFEKTEVSSSRMPRKTHTGICFEGKPKLFMLFYTSLIFVNWTTPLLPFFQCTDSLYLGCDHKRSFLFLHWKPRPATSRCIWSHLKSVTGAQDKPFREAPDWRAPPKCRMHAHTCTDTHLFAWQHSWNSSVFAYLASSLAESSRCTLGLCYSLSTLGHLGHLVCRNLT